ncbi:hypothetical protein IGJ48_001894 [Enterococcus pernyi]
MDYLILTNRYSIWLIGANYINHFDWKTANYIVDSGEMKKKFVDWESVISAKERDKGVGFWTRIEEDISDTNGYTFDILTILSHQHIKESI